MLVERLDITEEGDLVLVSVQGSHFLWKMVRRMVGVLVEIGKGAMPPDAIRTILAEGSTAPARVLRGGRARDSAARGDAAAVGARHCL